MNMRQALGSTSLFAHLSGVSRRAARADDAPAPGDEPDDKDARADAPDGEDEDDPKDKDKAARRARADGEDDDSSATEEDDDDKDKVADDEDDEDDKPAARRARADDEDDDKEEMNGRSAASKARRRERARCAAIFAAPQAAHNVGLAASLAFETTLTRKEALAVLRTGAAASRHGAGREAGNPRLGPGGESRPGGQASLDASWDRAINKVAGARTVRR